MFTNFTQKELDFAGKKLILESGKIARQADGAVMISYGKTKILCTVVYSKTKGNHDFFPLTVVYQERYHAAGKIPGGFLKRESKPSDSEVLTSRLIDRTIRPMFAESFSNEMQVVCTVFSYEPDTSPDFVALCGAVAAIKISGAPIMETVAGAKIGFIDEKYIINPSEKELRRSSLDMFLSGTKESILMVESEAKELSEEKMINAIDFGLKEISVLIDFIEHFASDMLAKTQKTRFEPEVIETQELRQKIKEAFFAKLSDAFKIPEKQERYALLETLKQQLKSHFLTENSTDEETNRITGLFKEIEKEVVRTRILEEGIRIDGRTLNQIRPIEIETGLLEMTHGSALFTRGETQALVTITKGGEKDGQMIDGMSANDTDSFMLHYNFPAYCVGEMSRFGAPGRREIGHGNLAKKAIRPILPNKDICPFTIRIVSDITESNGSSSMATVCGASLALINGGVPIKSACSGIAMGLIKEGEKYAILSDILGDEDFLGDMDFKVAGTKTGITALQMDIKIRGITVQIAKDAITQAKDGRLFILEKINAATEGQTKQVSEQGPRVRTLTIKENQIRQVIGQGGSVIKEICATSGASIDVGRDGKVKIMSTSKEAIDIATKMIEDALFSLDIGKIYTGRISKIVSSGAIVELEDCNVSGLVHISDMAINRIEHVSDIVLEGEKVFVKVISIEDKKPRLSIKVIDQLTGKDISKLIESVYSKHA